MQRETGRILPEIRSGLGRRQRFIAVKINEERKEVLLTASSLPHCHTSSLSALGKSCMHEQGLRANGGTPLIITQR